MKTKLSRWKIQPFGIWEYFEIEETVTIRGEEFTVAHEYMRQVGDDEWYEPIDDPDKNLLKDYWLYREEHKLLDPEMAKCLFDRFGMDTAALCARFGFDPNEWARYQQGCLQTPAFEAQLRQALTQLD